MSFLTAASERSSSGLSGASPSGFSPAAAVLSSLAPLVPALAAALGEIGVALASVIMVSVFTGFGSTLPGAAFAADFTSLLGATALAGAFASSAGLLAPLPPGPAFFSSGLAF